MKISQVLLFIFLVVATIATPQVKASTCGELWYELYECEQDAQPPGLNGNTCEDDDRLTIINEIILYRCFPFGFNF